MEQRFITIKIYTFIGGGFKMKKTVLSVILMLMFVLCNGCSNTDSTQSNTQSSSGNHTVSSTTNENDNQENVSESSSAEIETPESEDSDLTKLTRAYSMYEETNETAIGVRYVNIDGVQGVVTIFKLKEITKSSYQQSSEQIHKEILEKFSELAQSHQELCDKMNINHNNTCLIITDADDNALLLWQDGQLLSDVYLNS